MYITLWWKQGSSASCYTEVMCCILHQQEVGGAFSCLWVAPCSIRNDKKMGEHSNEQVECTMKDVPLKQLMVEVLTRVHQDKPA